MHEAIKRPEILRGTTYKITTPFYDHSVYITINDIVLNPGTDHEVMRPFEMFINSKNCCRERCIVVCNVRGYAVRTVAEHVFALILALRRSVLAYRDDVRAGRWQAARQFCFHDHPIRELHGASLGIIGEGALGQGVADLGRGFGMRVMFAAHKAKQGFGPLYTPFDEVLETADVITLHCPLLPETKAMLGYAPKQAAE